LTPVAAPGRDAWTAFGLGVLGGVLAGFALLSWIGIGVLAIPLMIGGARLRPRPFGASGLFGGWGVTWFALLGSAQARCGPDCVAPDLTPWLIVSASLLTASVILLAVGVRRVRGDRTANR
jgi:hypothetical protein